MSFSLQNLECFIFTCHKRACKLTYVEACSDRGKIGIYGVIIGNQNKIFKHHIAQFHY